MNTVAIDRKFPQAPSAWFGHSTGALALMPHAAEPVETKRGRRPGRAGWTWLVVFALAQFALRPPDLAAQTNDPAITQQPAGGKAAVGESFSFDVTATGTAPMTYQWRFNGVSLSGATNQSLELTNLTLAQSGLYSVRVENAAGSLVSSNANLLVSTNAPRKLTTGKTAVDLFRFRVELLLDGNGHENALAFSLRYNPAALIIPALIVATNGVVTNAVASVDLTRENEGLVGVHMDLPAGEHFPRGQTLLGELEFDLFFGADPTLAGLAFTNAPVAIGATNALGAFLALDTRVNPVMSGLDTPPKLDLQSGLFTNHVEVIYPGATTITNLELIVHDLGADSLTNDIFLFNAHKSATFDADDDGIGEENADVILIPTLSPGVPYPLVLEFFVSDHLTVPTPTYAWASDSTITLTPPTGGTAIPLRAVRYVNGSFLLEFPTKAGATYYVQYAATLEDLLNCVCLQTAFPSIQGTGSAVQWSDHGPPKTSSLPTDGMRFYQVIEIP